MKTKKKPKSELDIMEQKLMRGTRLAIKKLIEERKKEDGYLYFSKRGKVVKVRARDLK